MDIRSQTGLIVEKDGKYLVAAAGMFPRWSLSPWDAWRTRKRENALFVARAIRGNIMLFNPIVGQLRIWRESECRN